MSELNVRIPGVTDRAPDKTMVDATIPDGNIKDLLEIVTLNVSYLVEGSNAPLTVRIRMSRAHARQAIEHGRSTSRTPFYGTDARGEPFNIDVGPRAVAVYITEDGAGSQ